MNDDELEQLKQKKMEEMKKRMDSEQQQEQAEAQAEMQLNALLRKLLTDEARTRMNNVAMVNKALYLKASQTIVYLFQAGQVEGKLDDVQVKKLLEKLSAAGKKEINIRRK
ncbi:MAG: DNA-binding protein [Candidatus Diapherotrites archaeon]